MKKVLILLDDYNEMVFVETLLKKVGFDTVGIQNPKKLEDELISFGPQLLIVSHLLKNEEGSYYLKQAMEKLPRLSGMIIGNYTDEAFPTVIRPLDPDEFLKKVAETSGLDADKILEKFNKLGMFRPQESPSGLLDGKFQHNEEHLKARQERFAKALKGLPKPKTTKIERKVVTEYVKELRARGIDAEIEDIDQERKDFVDTLYKKAK